MKFELGSLKVNWGAESSATPSQHSEPAPSQVAQPAESSIEMMEPHTKASAPSIATMNTLTALVKAQGQTFPAFAGRSDEIAMASSSSSAYYSKRLPFSALRYVADNADLVRLAIEDIKSTIKGLGWSIRTGDGEEPDPRAYKLLEKPDGVREWDQWASMVAEETLVTDTMTLFPWYQNGTAYRLDVIDGTTIEVIPTADGRLKESPEDAYRQISASGMPKGFTTDELWVLPQNVRVTSHRGFSPVEYVLVRASINLRKILKDLERWLTGGMPGALAAVPNPEWTPKQVEEFQKWANKQMLIPGAESMIHYVAGGGRPVLLKPQAIDKSHEEILIRIIFKAFGVDPTALVSDVNYNTADALARKEQLRGIRPHLFMLQSVADRYLVEAGFVGHFFHWKVDEEASDQALREQRRDDFRSGLIGWQEMRQETGETTDPAAIANMNFFITNDLVAFNPLGVDDAPPAPPAPEPEPNDDPAAKAVNYREDLGKCFRMVRKAVKAGETPRQFQSDVIPIWRQNVIKKAVQLGMVDLIKAESTPDSRDEFPNHLNSTRVANRIEEGIELFAEVLRAQGEYIRGEALEVFQSAMTLKADGFDTSTATPIPSGLWDDVVDWLDVLALAGIKDSAEWVGLGQVGSASWDYARSRAGELIGMQLDPDTGLWMDTENTRWALSNTTKARVNSLLDLGLSEGWEIAEFREQLDILLDDPARAAMIATTEAAYAYNYGTATNWAAMGVTHVEIFDNEGPNSCAACIEINGQIWSVQKFRENPIEHPRCVRTGFPIDAPITEPQP